MFINYGMSVLKPGRSESVYQRTVDSVSVLQCAEQCLHETSFYCLSFDFIFTTAPAAAAAVNDVGRCRLSQHVAASANGLVMDTVNPQHNHYERIGQSVCRSALSCLCMQLLHILWWSKIGFFVNNSSNDEPIWTKFHIVTEAGMGCIPGNFGRPRTRATKMAYKKNELFLSGI